MISVIVVLVTTYFALFVIGLIGFVTPREPLNNLRNRYFFSTISTFYSISYAIMKTTHLNCARLVITNPKKRNPQAITKTISQYHAIYVVFVYELALVNLTEEDSLLL